MIGKAFKQGKKLMVITGSGIYDLDTATKALHKVKEGDILEVRIKDKLATVYGNKSTGNSESDQGQ